MIQKQNLSKFGIGTWGLGGFATKDPNIDSQKQIDALVYTLKNGINFIECGMWPAEGESVRIMAEALKESGISRDNVFITQTAYTFTATSVEDVAKEVGQLKELFETDYIDAIQVGKSMIDTFGRDEMYTALEGLLDTQQVRYVSFTNGDLATLKDFHGHFGDKVFGQEVCFNFEIRENEKLGILGYASKNDIMNVVYQPLRRSRTAQRNYPLLIELAEKYNKEQNQILFNWISRKGFLPITKSETITHIDQHLGSFDFEISDEDLERLSIHEIEGYISPEIDWNKSGVGVSVDQLSNVFDSVVDGEDNK